METLDLHLKQLVKLMKLKKENRKENINKDEKEVRNITCSIREALSSGKGKWMEFLSSADPNNSGLIVLLKSTKSTSICWNELSKSSILHDYMNIC